MNRRLLVLVLAALPLALPAAAQAAPKIEEICPFFCGATVTGVSGDDEITVQPHPTDGDGTRFVGQGASAGTWTIPGTCTQSVSATSTTVDCTTGWFGLTVDLGAGNDRLILARSYFGTTINAGAGNDTVAPNGALTGAVSANGGAGDDTLTGAAGADKLTGDDGRDTLTGNDGNDTVSGGAGPDTVSGGNGNDPLKGDAGDDTISGGAGADAIEGGGGRDVLTPGTEADTVQGGEGFDLVRYTDRSAPVAISLDAEADDGAAGEGDDVRPDVEDVIGGSGDDVLDGSDGDNILDGGPGADRITGGGGGDTVIGGDGDDDLRMRDGTREGIDCGAGADAVVGDEIDDLTDCEHRDLSADLVSDFDADGVSKPADCNDRDPDVRPGAPDAPDNGVDEDCSGADAVNFDRDGDGATRPADCDDGNAGVRPGAREIPGNSADEDCSGLAEPFPSITSPVVNSFAVFARFTRVKRLKVRDVPPGATVEVSCRGKGCPRKKAFRRTVRRRARLLDVRRAVRRARLRPGARLEVRITKPEAIGRVVRFKIRRRAVPTTSSRCLPPGKRKAEPC